MGLDVVAYDDLVEVPEKEWVNIPKDELWDVAWDKGWHMFSENWGFPGSAYPIEPNTPYTAEDSTSFRAGSYSGYGSWRNWLAQMAGYESAQAVWDACSEGTYYGPFVELINFSDCDGTLGTAIAAKLYKDFEEHRSKAQDWAIENLSEDDSEFFLDKYDDWMHACDCASNYGCIVFC